MPFTPYHMGPGILVKSVLQGSFSLMVFGWAQIVMNIQPLFVLISGEGHLHGFSHTFVGATLLAVVAALTGKYLSEIGLKVVGLSKQPNPITIKWWIVVVSAFIGTYSHIMLDAVMHIDMQPYFPINVSNPLLGVVSIPTLHKFCLYTGMLGALLYFFIQQRAIRTNK